MEDAIERFRSGMNAFNSGNIDKAIEELEVSTKLDPDNYKGFNYLGAAYASKKRYNAAIGAFKMAQQAAPDMASIHYNIAQVYEAMSIWDEAEYEYEQALTIDPLYSKANEALNKLKNKLNQISE